MTLAFQIFSLSTTQTMPKSKRRNRSNSKSGFYGVNLSSNKKKYQAKIQVNGKLIYLGSFDTAEQAAKRHDEQAIKLRRPLSKLNYPKEAPVGYAPVQQPLRSRNTVGYRGVHKNEKRKGKKFIAYIIVEGKQKHLGMFETAKEAAIAYDRAVLRAHKSTTLLNFPDMVHNLDDEPKQKTKKPLVSKKTKNKKPGQNTRALYL